MLKIINIETENLRPDELGFKDVRVDISVSDTTELKVAYGKFHFIEGSRAWVINEASYYGLNDVGAWIKQEKVEE